MCAPRNFFFPPVVNRPSVTVRCPRLSGSKAAIVLPACSAICRSGPPARCFPCVRFIAPVDWAFISQRQRRHSFKQKKFKNNCLGRPIKITSTRSICWLIIGQIADFLKTLNRCFKNINLEEKMTIPGAFRAAQRELREAGLDPYYWAGFVLVE